MRWNKILDLQIHKLFNMYKIFPILRIVNNNMYRFIGTGFFINKKGYFITAGHVFKNSGNYFIGIKNEDDDFDIYPVTNYLNLYKEDYYKQQGDYERGVERSRDSHQYGPEWQDIGVGATTYTSKQTATFKIKKPQNKASVSTEYYIRNDVLFPEAGIEIINNRLEGNKMILIHKDIEIIRKHNAVDHPYLGNSIGTNNQNKYSNCLWGKEDTNRGASGAAVVNQRRHVIGIIIGGNTRPDNVSYILLSKYVQKRAMRLLHNMQSL